MQDIGGCNGKLGGIAAIAPRLSQRPKHCCSVNTILKPVIVPKALVLYKYKANAWCQILEMRGSKPGVTRDAKGDRS
ncbi:MAG: hypothetical protein PUP93_34330 [Rhizonema sp. NSF051]|nr:hypothetical protein [Rhizonema sp. NSF051]